MASQDFAVDHNDDLPVPTTQRRLDSADSLDNNCGSQPHGDDSLPEADSLPHGNNADDSLPHGNGNGADDSLPRCGDDDSSPRSGADDSLPRKGDDSLPRKGDDSLPHEAYKKQRTKSSDLELVSVELAPEGYMDPATIPLACTVFTNTALHYCVAELPSFVDAPFDAGCGKETYLEGRNMKVFFHDGLRSPMEAQNMCVHWLWQVWEAVGPWGASSASASASATKNDVPPHVPSASASATENDDNAADRQFEELFKAAVTYSDTDVGPRGASSKTASSSDVPPPVTVPLRDEDVAASVDRQFNELFVAVASDTDCDKEADAVTQEIPDVA